MEVDDADGAPASGTNGAALRSGRERSPTGKTDAAGGHDGAGEQYAQRFDTRAEGESRRRSAPTRSRTDADSNFRPTAASSSSSVLPQMLRSTTNAVAPEPEPHRQKEGGIRESARTRRMSGGNEEQRRLAKKSA